MNAKEAREKLEEKLKKEQAQYVQELDENVDVDKTMSEIYDRINDAISKKYGFCRF